MNVARAPRWLAVAASLSVVGVGLGWGTFAAGGSDSYCYVSQAHAWLDGTLLRPQQLDFAADWPHAAETLAPAGYVPSTHLPGGIAPICPPGFALTLAGALAIGGERTLYAVVPVLGGVLVWSTFLWAAALGGPWVGAASAILTATSPIALYQVVQPMSDIPAAAWWMLALALVTLAARPHAPAADANDGAGDADVLAISPRRLVAAGAAMSMAVLTRPNLAPTGLVVLAAAWTIRSRSTWRARAGDVLAVVGGAAPGALATALAHRAVYGSPVRAGYGDLGALFGTANVVPNLLRYPTWLVDSQTPLVVAAIGAPFVLRTLQANWRQGPRGARPARPAWMVATGAAFTASVVGPYLLYVPFDDWWYLRFLLPALPVVLTLAIVTWAAAIGWATSRLGSQIESRFGSWLGSRFGSRRGWLGAVGAPVLLMALTSALGTHGARLARDRLAFSLWRSDRRFVTTGEVVAAKLPASAVVWSIFHSGNIRLYGHRPTVLWDTLPPDWLDRSIDALRAQGRESYLVVESWEEERFRERFEAASRLGALDWPPHYRVGNAVRIFSFAERDSYFAGTPVPTETIPVFPRRRR